VDAAEAERCDRLIDRLAADAEAHLLTGPVEEPELQRVEALLGCRIPPAFRSLLGRLGSGILYDRHELFGARPLLLHDIEFVPSLLSVQSRLNGTARRLLAFHRGGGAEHAFLVDGAVGEPVPVVSLDGARRYADFARFLQAVVLADRP
jgi:hypothetical protein